MGAIIPTELERLKAAGRRMYQAGLTTGTLGSIGVRLSGGAIAVTAVGTHIGSLDSHDFLVLDSNHLPVRQNGRAPVMDAKMLAAALEAQPAAGSVIRVHSPYTTALSHKGNALLEESRDMLEGVGGVEFVPYRLTGAKGLASAVAEALKTNKVAMIEGQGCVVWGEDIDDAVDCAEALEAAAKVIFILRDRDTGV
jgi:ribulose-5-phosphate 4-epimerase/fuculose-1-phosphate aldolase